QIAAAGSNSYALLADGTVWAWGYNGMGQLGLPATGTGAFPFSSVPVRVNYADGTPVIATKIAAGLDHVLALVPGGTVVAWGFNELAQLGNNAIINSFVPVTVLGPGSGNPNAPLSGVTEI